MEYEEEAHVAVDTATAIAADEAESKDTTNMARAVQLRNDCAKLSAPACLTTVVKRQQTNQDYHGRNSCNTLA